MLLEVALSDLGGERCFQWTIADDLAAERNPACLEFRAGGDEIGESLFLDEPADGDDQRNGRLELRQVEAVDLDAVIDAPDLRRVRGETLLQLLDGKLANGDDRGRRIEDRFQADDKIPWRENVIRVRRYAEVDSEESIDPIGSPRRHPGEMRVDAPNPRSLKSQPDVGRLIEPEEIRLPPPLLHCAGS